MSKIEVHVKDHTKDVEAAVQAKITLALAAMGEVVEGHAKEYSPVDTGNLRNSITHEPGEDCEYVGTNVEYAPYVEFIDRYHHPVGKAHYLRDGAQNYIPELRDTAATILGSI